MFEDMGELYDRARPRYPPALFDDALELARLSPPARLLEIGPGTGFATAVLAERGFRIVGVEPEESMARIARAICRWSPEVEIVVGSFETYEPDGIFDAVVAFSAFHWLDPNVRYERVASVTHDGGFLVVADARLAGGDDPFFLEVEEDYDIVLGERANEQGAPGLGSLRDELHENGVFEHVGERRYGWHVTYTDDGYVELLETFPWYRALDSAERAELFARIRERIRKRPERTIRARFEAVLDVARRGEVARLRP